MASKNITIKEETYEKLRAHKRSDESFSDVIDRLATARTDPMDSAGAFPGLGETYEEAHRSSRTTWRNARMNCLDSPFLIDFVDDSRSRHDAARAWMEAHEGEPT